MNLLKNVSVREIGAPVAAGSTIDNNSDIVDMANYEGVMFLVPITDSVDTGVAALTVEQNTANSASGMAALSGAVATATSGADDDLNGKLLVVDVYRPRERYLQAVRTSATANIAYGNVIAILYKGRVKPTTDDTSIAHAVQAISPAES